MSRRWLWTPFVAALLGLPWWTASQAGPPPADAFKDEVEPFLRRYCFECHAGADPYGELRLDTVQGAAGLQADRETWTRVRAVLHTGDMPPFEAQRQPKPA